MLKRPAYLTPVSHYVSCICLLLLLKVLFIAIAIVNWQSQYNDTDGVGFILKGIFAKKFFNHLASHYQPTLELSTLTP